MRPFLGAICLLLALIAICVSVTTLMGMSELTTTPNAKISDFPLVQWFAGEQVDGVEPKDPAEFMRKMNVRVYTVALSSILLIAMGLILIFAGRGGEEGRAGEDYGTDADDQV